MAEYPYFWGTLAGILVFVPLAAARRGQLRASLFSGLALAPTGLLAFSFGDYWTPARLGDLPVGLEDVMFSFASGLAAWVIAVVAPVAGRLAFDWDGGRIARRAAPIVVAIPLLYFVLLRLGLDPMTGLLAGLLAAAVVGLARRPGLWPLAVPGAIGYPILHVAAVALAYRAWPSLRTVWNPDHFWGAPFVLGVPVGEHVWAVVFGACWPVIVADFLGARAPRPVPAALDV